MRKKFGEVIGERRLQTKVGRGERVVTVTLGKPRRRKDGDWECPFRITGLGIRYGYGVDALQALITAVEGIRVVLATSGKKLAWLGGEIGDIGFYRLVPTCFGVRLSNKLNRMLDREIAKFVDELKRKHRRKRKSTRQTL